jgi:hypothetical protein
MARKSQVVIKSMGANFAAANVVAVIPDARDLGVQLSANDGGSAFFTLPLDHPAVPLIQPLSQHYFIQRWNGSSYVTIQGGIITDYDAGANEVVISGVDYMTALNKYYTPIHGPTLGDKAIPNNDTTTIGSTTPKAIIAAALAKDTAKSSEGYAVSVVDSSYPNVGQIAVYSGVPQVSTQPTGTRDSVTVTYEEVAGVKTGAIILSGSLYIWRDAVTTYFQDGETGKQIEGNFSIGTSSSSQGRIGMMIYANPGGPLYYFYNSYYLAPSAVDIGMASGSALNFPQQFSIKLRPVSHYNAADEVQTGLNRVVSCLTEGVSYTFYCVPIYLGNLSPKDATADYDQYIWGKTTRELDQSFAAGLQSDTLYNSISNLLTVTTDPMYVLDRKDDYPDSVNTITSFVVNTSKAVTFTLASILDVNVDVGDTVAVTGSSNATYNISYVITSISSDRKTVGSTVATAPGSNTTVTGGTMTKDLPTLNPIIKFMGLEQLGTATSTVHPYITTGQGPVDFMRELTDIEVGSRIDGSKVVFNFYGVPSGAADGTKLSVNHSVSNQSQATLVYPGQIKDFNVTNRRSGKMNSVRVIPTTAFLIGATTDGAPGVKSKGVVKNPKYSASDPALPVTMAQRGFISQTSAKNFAQGLVNDYGTDERIQDLRISLRTEQFGPIGISGTPKLGETVTVVIRRKGTTVGSDIVSGNYNVNGMSWHARIDGHEDLQLSLIKPTMFKGPAVSWENKPAPKPTSEPTKTKPAGGGGDKPETHAGDGGVIPDAGTKPGSTGAFTGTSYMYNSKPSTVVGVPRLSNSTKRNV